MDWVELLEVFFCAIMIVKNLLIIDTLVLTKTSHDQLNVAWVKLVYFVEIAFDGDGHPEVLFL